MGDCHYLDGNVKARRVVQRAREIMTTLGMNPERLRLRWVSASEGARFAKEVNEFAECLRKGMRDCPSDELEDEEGYQEELPGISGKAM